MNCGIRKRKKVKGWYEENEICVDVFEVSLGTEGKEEHNEKGDGEEQNRKRKD